MRRHTPKYVISLAQDLRQAQTQAEELLWERLRNNQLNGFKFYRQCPVGRYISDFYCAKLRLVIELDGEIHDIDHSKEYDEVRNQDMVARSLTVLRFRNEQVLKHMDEVLAAITTYANPEVNRHIGEKNRT